jgi:hypothetical protein
VAAARYTRHPAREHLLGVVCLAVLTLVLGGLGFTLGLQNAYAETFRIGADRQSVIDLGVENSLHNVTLALALLAFAGIIAAVGAWRPAPKRVRLTFP